MLEKLAAGQFGVFSREQARRLGVSDDTLRRLVRAGVVERMQPGAFKFAAAPETWHASLKGVCIWGGAGTWASHRSAGALWGLEGVLPGHLEISTVRRIRCGDKRIVLHRLEAMPPGDVRTFGTFPVTSVARTLVDLSGVFGAEVLEAALDHALRERMTSVAALDARLCELGGKGRTGTGVLRRLLEDRGAGTRPVESRAEVKLVRLLEGAGLPRPQRQYTVRDGPRFVARLDFAYPRWRVGIEFHSYRYHSSRRAWKRDLERNYALVRLGWRILYVTWEEVVNSRDVVVSRVSELLGPISGADGLIWDRERPARPV